MRGLGYFVTKHPALQVKLLLPDPGVRSVVLRDGRGLGLQPPPQQVGVGVVLRRLRSKRSSRPLLS